MRYSETGRWGIVIGIALLGVVLSASAQAAVFTVNNPFDVSDASPGNGVCETAPGNRICTLRAAVQESNVLTGDDTIILPPNIYLLTQLAELTITRNLTITGGRASTTIIDGNKSVRADSGVLRINSGAIVSISGVTIRNGTKIDGGGIDNSGMLTLSNSTVSGNSASLGGGISNGGTLTIANSTVNGNGPSVAGGILNVGTLTVTNSTVSGNNGGTAGGIYNNGTLSLTNSTVSANSGGGINNIGTATLTNSTVSGNSASLGGGIFNQLGILTLSNSTVSGNSATGNGGGIHNTNGTANLFNATVTNNLADSDFNGSGTAGGVSGLNFNLQNSIVAGNFPSDCGGIINLNGNNLFGSLVNCTVQGNGSGITLADPKLGPLQDNGGPTQTQTHALLSGSPAIDGGNPSGCQDDQGRLLTTDQRGFRRTVDGNADGTARCDIGAVEFDAETEVTPDIDFDGDGRSDIAVYRDGVWWILRSSNGGGIGVTWGGAPQDIPVPGDYDGEGKTDQAVYRDGVWWILRSSNGGGIGVTWGGAPQDIPVPGDYDGDGKTDQAVYRDGIWWILRSFDGGWVSKEWGGAPQDIPLNRRSD